MNSFKLIKLACSTLFVAVITLASVCHASVIENKATNESPGTTTNLTEKKQVVAVPNIADVIPLASKLTGRLADLENRVKGIRDIAVVEIKYAEIETALQDPADQLEKFKESNSYMYNNPGDMYQNLLELREGIREENHIFDRVSEPLHGAIRQLGELRNEWRTEKELWENGSCPWLPTVSSVNWNRSLNRRMPLSIQPLILFIPSWIPC